MKVYEGLRVALPVGQGMYATGTIVKHVTTDSIYYGNDTSEVWVHFDSGLENRKSTRSFANLTRTIAIADLVEMKDVPEDQRDPETDVAASNETFVASKPVEESVVKKKQKAKKQAEPDL